MDLNIKNQRFIVCGASSGFGRAIAEQLLTESASIIAVARRREKLVELDKAFPGKVATVAGNLLKNETHDRIAKAVSNDPLHGVILNAGGPPALTPLETSINDWDEAYKQVMRWKVELLLRLVPHFTAAQYGRVLFVESQSVKQPIPTLVLSNAFRAGIVGFAKSMAQEVADEGVTVNVLAPGSHDTPAIERVIQKKVEASGESYKEVKKQMETAIPVGRFGKATEIASLAAWLLSPHSSYLTGQTLSHAGGHIKGLFG